jgi:hypothetical protein
MEQTVRNRKIAYPTARDPKLKTQKAWQVHYHPTHAIVDWKGIARIISLQPEYIEQVVK